GALLAPLHRETLQVGAQGGRRGGNHEQQVRIGDRVLQRAGQDVLARFFLRLPAEERLDPGTTGGRAARDRQQRGEQHRFPEARSHGGLSHGIRARRKPGRSGSLLTVRLPKQKVIVQEQSSELPAAIRRLLEECKAKRLTGWINVVYEDSHDLVFLVD